MSHISSANAGEEKKLTERKGLLVALRDGKMHLFIIHIYSRTNGYVNK